MKIQSVTIEGMHKVTRPTTYEFKDFNYVIGPNGSGKSTVLQALQLAILGYIPGTAKSNSAIMEHSNGPVMRVKVLFDDGSTIERSWATNGRTINAESKVPGGYDPKSVLGDLELPIFNFSEFLELTANKAKDWFMNFLPGVDSRIDWDAQLRESVKDMNLIDPDLISDTVSQLSQVSGDDTIDMIRKCNEALKENLSFSKGELQKIQGTIQSLIYHDDVADSNPDASLIEIKKQLDGIASAESAIHAHQSAVDSNARINALLSGLTECIGERPEDNPKYSGLISQQNNLRAELNSLTASPQDIVSLDTSSIDSQISHLQEQYSDASATVKSNEKLISGKGICPYTDEECESIKNKMKALNSESDKAKKKMIEIKDSISALEKQRDDLIRKFNDAENERRSKIRDCEIQLSAVASQVKTIERDYEMRKSYESQLVEVPTAEGLKSWEEYQILKSELIERSNKLSANKKYNELIETLTADKYKIENTIEAYKIWIKLTGENGLQTTLMEAPFTEFESDMNTFIKQSFGNDTECKFNLSTKANSFSYGILRNHQFIPYNLLSSGEKAMYTFALMRCIVSGYDSQLKLLVVDDMSDHLDSDNLRSTFESLNDTKDMQIILAGVNVIDDLSCNLISIRE